MDFKFKDDENLSEAFEIIRDKVKDPKKGLGTNIFHFVSSLTPIVNVDLLIKNSDGQTLLSWRSDEFYGPGWHLPGGVVRFKEDPKVRVNKVAQNELGCDVTFFENPIHVRSRITEKRDIRGHFITLLYACSLLSSPDVDRKSTTTNPFNGQWAWHDKAPKNLLTVHESFRKFIDEK